MKRARFKVNAVARSENFEQHRNYLIKSGKLTIKSKKAKPHIRVFGELMAIPQSKVQSLKQFDIIWK